MGAAAEFDIGPLTWVKGEIEQALAKAGAALAAYLANPADATQLKFCKTHLHQAHGALEIVGLEGVTRLTEECERVLESAESGAVPLDAERGAALALAFESLPKYLNELVDGAPHQPVRLFPAYRAVMQARGAERIAESDLFFPDLSARPPQRETPDLPADMREHVLAQRRRFQSGLLRWLRNSADASALKDMGEAVRAIERSQALPQHRAFWWITTGFAETLQEAGGGVDLEAKRLCARIDMQMKRLMEGSQNVAQRLMRDALYFVAKSKASGGSVKELRAFYRLEGVVPEALSDDAKARPFEAHLRAIREILGGAKEKWNKFSAGQAHELTGFKDQSALLKERTAALGHPDLARLVNAISTVTLWVAENPSKVTEPIALETATALLLAENAVDNFARLGEEFTAQVATMGARLKASLNGQTADMPAVPLLDEMSRKAQERLLMAQVVGEIKSNLGGIETALDAFFRDSSKRSELPALDGQIRQVLGALMILGADKAVVALQGCQADITRFIQPDYAPVQDDFERVANTLSGLGFYVDALQHGAADYDEVVKPVSARDMPDHAMDAADEATLVLDAPMETEAPAGPGDGTVEGELEQEKKDARTLFDAWRQQPQDAVLTAELKASLESIKNDADLVDDPTLRMTASDILKAMQSEGGPALDMLDQAMAKIAPAAPVAPAAAVATAEPPPVQQPAEEVDAELLAIFLEEAQEVLQTIEQQHAVAVGASGNKDCLTTIRRAFHTLKGSGRMVGLMRFGEAAWSIEQTMNQWLQEERPANQELLGLIEGGRELFARWVHDLSTTGQSALDGKGLAEAAARVQAGQAYAVAASSIPMQAAIATTPDDVAAPVDPTVLIGDIRVSRGLYNIFVDEAGGHLAAIKSELSRLADEVQPPRDELVRAVHTLAGIAGTVNFKKLNELGRAFERMLLAAKSGGVALSGPDLGLANESHVALENMVLAVRELQPPSSADSLVERLELRRADWMGALDEPDPILSGFVLPVAVAATDTPEPLTPEMAGPEIDFSALAASAPEAQDIVASTSGDASTSDFTLDMSSLVKPALDLASTGSKAPAAELPGDFSFHVEDITLPPAAVSAETPAAPEEPSLRFIEVSAPPAPVPQTATIELPDLGDRTILVAASDAMASIDAQHAAAGAIADSASASGLPSEDELRARGFEPSDRRQERLDDEIDEQLLPIFLEEANELMPRIGEELRSWADGGNPQALQRSLHTLKGSARMAGAMALGQLTHSMETRVENALQLPNIPPAIFEGLFSSFDRTTMLVDRLKNFDPSDKTQMVKAGRDALAEDDASKLVRAFDEAAPMPAASAAAQTPAAPQSASAKAAEDARAMLRVRADVVDRLVNEAGEVAIARSRVEGEMRAIKSSLKDLTENLIRLRSQLREIEIAAESQMQSRQREVEEKHDSFDPLEFDRFSRFQEITRSMAESVNDVATVQQNLLKNLDEADAALLSQGRLSRDLQNDLMRVRMVPFNNVAERLYRVVRQTAKELGKRANLDIKGTQTEIDRSVLERMTGPFEHLLRNGIAHGLEDPAGRAAAGKAEIGQLGLSARQEGNEFVLVFEDDGRGLDIARIRAKAVANGLMGANDQLPDAQIAEFIFASGFSTAQEISEVSGRGVGMDVVRAEVTALGGRVEIDFTPGQGSRFTIYLPLTLAVTQVVLIRAGSREFAVPSAMVEQVRQIKVDELEKAYAEGKVEWLGREYPLQFLPRLLGDASQTAETQRFTPVLLLRSGTQRAAIHVDELIGNQEVVVKNIGPQLARVAGIAGATVLGTGQIVLILNPVPLVFTQAVVTPSQAGVVAGSSAEAGAASIDASNVAPPVAAVASPVSGQPTVMVVDDSLTVRKITTRLLSRENYQPLTAKDGVDALEQLQELRPDVMLVDVEMPRMDGFDLTRNIRGDDRLKDIPIIMITSRTADKHRNYAMEIGVNVFLGKPYQEEELLEHIAYLIKNRAAAA